MDLDRIVTLRLEEFNQELYSIERRLEEYAGLKTEREIKIEEGYYRAVKRFKLLALELNGRLPRARSPVLEDAVADWDWANTNFTLDTSRYRSEPSSLKFTGDNGNLCRISATTALRDGRIVTFFDATHGWTSSYGAALIVFFRGQDPVGSITTQYGYILKNGYMLYKYRGYARAYLYRDGSSVTYKNIYSDIVDTVDYSKWHKYRVTWWSDPGGAGLVARFEVLVAGEWKKACDDIVDTVDKYKDSSINRCGIACEIYSSAYPGWYDDTEIWGPA